MSAVVIIIPKLSEIVLNTL